MKIIKDPETQEAVEPDPSVLTQLLKYSFKYTPRVEHDFTKSRYVTYYLKMCAHSSFLVQYEYFLSKTFIVKVV